jgi:hypothetical protein
MTALGHKRTFPGCQGMSALPPKADIQAMSLDPTNLDRLIACDALGSLLVDSCRTCVNCPVWSD